MMADRIELKHSPVMCSEIIKFINPRKNYIYVDGTFGRGGHSLAILNKEENCKVFAIDRDPEAVEYGKQIEKIYPDRFKILLGCYGDMDLLLATEEISFVHGVILDLGVSSPQLEDSNRGFSFLHDGPLDMRMSKKGLSVEEVVNKFNEEKLSNIIYRLGEEKYAKQIAYKIVKSRKEKPIKSTLQLAEIVNNAVKKKYKKINPATKTFQALRIYVNDELEELDRGLKAAEKILLSKGYLLVISFHSLEDRVVKKFLCKSDSHNNYTARYLPKEPTFDKRTFLTINKKVIKASVEEIKNNPRARSAKLRIAEKI